MDNFYNLFGGSAGGGLEYHASTKVLSMDIHPTIGNWCYAFSKNWADLNHYYTLIGCYDGTNVRLYADGILQQSTLVENMKNSSYNVNIGAALNNNLLTASNISLKEAMLYDRSLTEDEVKVITSGFEKKYK